MKGRIGLTLGMVGFVFGVGVHRADAGLVTWEFAGEVTEVFDSQGLVDGIVEVGSPFSASLTFDSTTPDDLPDDPDRGDYRNLTVALEGAIDGIQFFKSGRFGVLLIRNPLGESDIYELVANDLMTGLFDDSADIVLLLADSSGHMFQDDSLPLTPPMFTSGRFDLQIPLQSVSVRGNITSVVPEPSVLPLLLVGATSFVVRRKRRATTARVSGIILLAVTAAAPTTFAQWGGGPVLIGGDVTDRHFEDPPRGRIYMREGFDFLGPLVGNGNRLAVCVGCDPDTPARTRFISAFDDSEPPEMTWGRDSISGAVEIEAFFGNAGDVKLEDTGIIYFPSAISFIDGGLDSAEITAINNNALTISDFVRVDHGGLFSHAIAVPPGEPPKAPVAATL